MLLDMVKCGGVGGGMVNSPASHMFGIKDGFEEISGFLFSVHSIK